MHPPHSPSLIRCLLPLVVLVCLAASVAGQPPPGPGLAQPRLLIVSPAGGQAGTTVEATLTGNDLDDPQRLLFSHPGLKAEFVPGSMTAPTRAPQGQLPTMTCKFKVTIPRDVPPGPLDVRLVNKLGISNPRAFHVGTQPEFLEKEPNNDVGEAQGLGLGSTVHGAISQPTDVDYYRFSGKKGQRVVVSCLASSIDSRLHPALQLYDRSGALLASGRNYRGTDALCDCTLPADGDYQVRLFAFAYLQGSAEHFYRLTVSTAPWIDAVFPPLVEPGKPAQVTVYGRNLPGGRLDPTAVVDGSVLEKATVTVAAPDDPHALARLAFRGHVPPVQASVDGFEYTLQGASGTSNPYLLAYAQAPVVLERDGNDTAETPQEVALPCEIAGRIEKKRDRDWYSFKVRKGAIYSIELYGDRLGSDLDLYAALRRPRGQVMTEMDDSNEPVVNQFFNRTDDPPRYRFEAPEDGTYLLHVASREADIDAGPRHLYRVRITPERPDFRLVLMPPAPNAPDAGLVRRGAAQAFLVFVNRIDGFAGEITLTAEGLPKGVTCPRQVVPAGARQAALVVTAAPDAPLGGSEFRVVGTATIDDRKVVREARAATITWPLPQGQNAPTVSRLDRALVLAVCEPGPYTLTTRMSEAKVTQGDRLTVPLKLDRNWPDFKAAVQVTALTPPPGITLPQTTIAPDRKEGTVTLDVRSSVPPGVYAIVLRGQAVFPYSKDPKARQKANVTVIQPAPPLVLTVLPRAKK
jgi:hypothetical protein